MIGLLTEDFRSVTKKVFNILLNASDGSKAVQAIREQGLLSNRGPVGVNGEESFIDLMYGITLLSANILGQGLE